MNYSTTVLGLIVFVWTFNTTKLFSGYFSLEYVEWIDSFMHTCNFIITINEIA